jgi:hypothetical protein
MSETEGSTSVIDLEGNFRTVDVEIPELKGASRAPVQKPSISSQERVPKQPRAPNQTKPAELKAIHKDKIQQILKKHGEERKLLQKEIKEQARRNREDLGKALKQTEKTYHAQLERLRQDYELRSSKLQNELEVFLAGKMAEMKQHNQEVILNDSQDRLEKLQGWLHGEFVSELQTKTNEFEQLKASSDSKVESLVHEVDRKNQEIIHLQNKIREITQHLKRGTREQILDELHLAELDTDEKVRKKKKQHKGLFARFSSKF